MQLRLSHQRATLSNLNIRSEIHGDDHEPACDLKLECDVDSGILAEFDSMLRSFLFEKDVTQLDLDDATLTKLRCPRLSMPIKFDDEIVGAAVTVHYGIGASDIVLDACRVNNWQITAREGGTVSLALRVQAKPSESQIGKLATMVQTEIEISIEPPSAE